MIRCYGRAALGRLPFEVARAGRLTAERLAPFVAGFLERCGERLAPGDLVIAGALAPAAPVVAGDTAELAVSGVGSVSLSFAA